MPNPAIQVDLKWRDTIINSKEVGSIAVNVLAYILLLCKVVRMWSKRLRTGFMQMINDIISMMFNKSTVCSTMDLHHCLTCSPPKINKTYRSTRCWAMSLSQHAIFSEAQTLISIKHIG